MRGTHQGQQSPRTASTGRTMTANDPCATRHMTSCRAGGREMTCCPSTLALATLRITTLA